MAPDRVYWPGIKSLSGFLQKGSAPLIRGTSAKRCSLWGRLCARSLGCDTWNKPCGFFHQARSGNKPSPRLAARDGMEQKTLRVPAACDRDQRVRRRTEKEVRNQAFPAQKNFEV